MSDKPWKRLEREVAKFFGTTRRLRGNDFSKSDIEVIASLKDAQILHNCSLESQFGVAVECKYRKSQPLVSIYSSYCFTKKQKKKNSTLLFMGDYYLCDLYSFKDAYYFFEEIYRRLDSPVRSELPLFFNKNYGFDLVYSDKTIPDYLDEYYGQASSYLSKCKEDGLVSVLPLVCLGQANKKQKIIIGKVSDLDSFFSAMNSH
jgi:hypothetical protein